MLAAIIANLQNDDDQPAVLPTIKVDRGGGGPSWPSYDLVDVVGALNSFREIPGEHPVARAARRHQHIGLHLQAAKQARETREAAVFLAGVTLATQVAEAKIGETEADLARVIGLYDQAVADLAAARAATMTASGRGAYASAGGTPGSGIAPFVIVGVAGIVIGVALARRR